MKVRNDYRSMNNSIRALIHTIKAERRMDDADIGKMIGFKAGTIRNHRCNGTLPNLQFCKVIELADQAGYDVKFTRKEEKK